MKRKKSGLLIILIGILVVLYPIISNILMAKTQTKVISTYDETIAKMEKEQIESEKEKARLYNERLTSENAIRIDMEESDDENISYMNVLNVGDIMGYISIPKIEAYLPIYHGTSENVLQSGVGHVNNSSLPIGEKNSHTVLAGHSGLVRTKIFDQLNKLEENDMFFIYMFDEVFAYRVNQIKVVLPNNTQDVQIVNGKEYVTLLTCTPYAINSHRLLVRGERVEGYVVPEENENENANTNTNEIKQDVVKDTQNIEKKIQKTNVKIIIAVILVVIFIVVLMIFIVITIHENNRIKKKIQKIKENKQD